MKKIYILRSVTHGMHIVLLDNQQQGDYVPAMQAVTDRQMD